MVAGKPKKRYPCKANSYNSLEEIPAFPAKCVISFKPSQSWRAKAEAQRAIQEYGWLRTKTNIGLCNFLGKNGVWENGRIPFPENQKYFSMKNLFFQYCFCQPGFTPSKSRASPAPRW